MIRSLLFAVAVTTASADVPPDPIGAAPPAEVPAAKPPAETPPAAAPPAAAPPPAAPPASAPVGVVVGKEAYVYAAYAVTWVTFLGYGLSLWARRGGVR